MRVMLAPSQMPDLEKIQYPIFASPKLDGIRAVVRGSVVLSRTGKPIPSFQVQDEFNSFENYDGELIVGDPTDPLCYNRTQSHVMAFEKETNDLVFYVFDYIDDNKPYFLRLAALKAYANVNIIEQKEINSLDELLEFEANTLALGYEGVMLKTPFSKYKRGRATLKEGVFFKLKRFQDDEGEIIGFIEGKENTNPSFKSEIGLSARSYKKEGLVRRDTVGSILVRYKNEIIRVAPGTLTHTQRDDIWDRQEDFIGRTIRFKFFPYGAKDALRFPRFSGFREDLC